MVQRISDVIKIWTENSPDSLALVESSGAWTYAQLASSVRRTQEWLIELGVRAGDRVMVVCENCKALVAILFATTELDAWPVLVNARLSTREIDEIREHCGARLVLFTTDVSAHAGQHAKRHGAIIKAVPALGVIGVGALDTRASPEPLDPKVGNRIAALIYTSGTTGLPKGVMLTHSNLLFVATASADIRKLGSQDRLYGVLPISHAVGLSVVLLGALLRGATLHLAVRFDPVAALHTIGGEKLTIVLGAPSMFSLLLEYARLKGIGSLSFASLRIISSSSAPLQLALKKNVEGLFGLVLHNGYGVTECSPNIAQTRIESPRNDVSVGQVLPGVEIKLVATNGEPVADGEVGELSVRGPNVMKGYYRNPEETAAVIDSAGWFNTKDLARVKDGNLYIVGRTKELIVRFGFNVYPAEVEGVLNSHPAVVRSAVIGRSLRDESGNEEIVAFVQLSEGSTATIADLETLSANHLAPYKRPSHFLLVPTMPLTPTGKVIKEALINILEASNGMSPSD